MYSSDINLLSWRIVVALVGCLALFQKVYFVEHIQAYAIGVLQYNLFRNTSDLGGCVPTVCHWYNHTHYLKLEKKYWMTLMFFILQDDSSLINIESWDLNLISNFTHWRLIH